MPRKDRRLSLSRSANERILGEGSQGILARLGPMFLHRLVVLLSLLCVSVLLSACTKGSAAAADAAVELPVVTDTTPNLLLTWIDNAGVFHVEQKVSDVPPAARDLVWVRDLTKEAAGDEIAIADLRNAGANGAYPVRLLKRIDFEKLALDRRDGGATLAARPPTAGDPNAPGSAEAARPAVIIYGASWCGPCHQAAAYLKKRGIAFVEKDIEEDAGAAREMHAKLAAAGKRGGSIPVLDVRGKLVIGFDARAVETALGNGI